jgi:hypothetical protein
VRRIWMFDRTVKHVVGVRLLHTTS